MAKIRFDIKYRPEIESGKYKVVTANDERPVKILTFERQHRFPILALINRGYDEIYEYDINGMTQMAGDTLYVITDEPELTEFEKAYLKSKHHLTPEDILPEFLTDNKVREYAQELLAVARKQLQPEIDAEIDKAFKNADKVQYENGKQDALVAMPHWKHMYAGAAGNGDGRNLYLIKDGLDTYRLSPIIASCDDYLVLSELDKLPKE